MQEKYTNGTGINTVMIGQQSTNYIVNARIKANDNSTDQRDPLREPLDADGADTSAISLRWSCSSLHNFHMAIPNT